MSFNSIDPPRAIRMATLHMSQAFDENSPRNNSPGFVFVAESGQGGSRDVRQPNFEAFFPRWTLAINLADAYL